MANWRRPKRRKTLETEAPHSSEPEGRPAPLPDGSVTTRGDAPVGADGDELGRARFAELIATQVALSRPSFGMVMSLTGPWGAGKSSVLRMVAEALRARHGDQRIIIINYNPWFFSGTDQLTSGFLLTLADQLPKSLGETVAANVAGRLRRYGNAVGTLRSLPGLGGIFGTAHDLAKEGAVRLDPEDVDLLAQRDQLADALDELKVHVVVIVDDVDRLQSAQEIRQLMQMVKLVGDLPGVTYLLAFDARPVRKALTSDGIEGHEYLEKIVQVEHVLPAVSEERLYGMLDRELDKALAGLPQDRIDQSRWPAVYEQIVRPLVQTPRHVRRLTNALPLAITLAGDDIDLTDLVALTAISAFLPAFHAALGSLYPNLVPGTMQAFRIFAGQGKEEAAEQLKAAAANSGNEAVALASYNLLFPHTGHALGSDTYGSGTENDWKRLRRVAEHESLYRYLTALTPDEGLSATETQRLLDATRHDDAFARALDGLDCQQLVVVAMRIAVHAPDVAAKDIPAVARELNRRARQECGAVHTPIWDPADRIEGAIAALVQQLPSEQRRAQLKAWFDEETDLTNKLAVFEVGRRTDEQQQPLAGEELLNEMIDGMIVVLEELPADQAQALPDIGRIMWLASGRLLPEHRNRLHALLADDWLLARFLLSFTEPSFGDGPRPMAWTDVKNTLGADWVAGRVKALTDHVGTEPEVNEAVQTAKHHVAREAGERAGGRPPAAAGTEG